MGFCCIPVPGKSGYMYVDLFIILKQLAVSLWLIKYVDSLLGGSKLARILYIGLWLDGIEYTEI